MDGLLVIDKPAGLTSHDIVVWGRRILHESRVGHTGTLDPAATGVLPLVVGRATRLARFLSAASKSYEAVIRLGVATDTADAGGKPIGEAHEGPLPSRDAIDRALSEFRGTFLQQPPAYSAKKIGGTRSYVLARASRSHEPVVPSMDLHLQPVAVTAYKLEIVDVLIDRVTLLVECSSGFYVRALAHDLGERLGVGAHLANLRRTRTGDYAIADAVSLEALERDAAEVARRLVPLASMLPGVPALVLTADGVRRACHGQDVGAVHAIRGLGMGDWGPNPPSRLSVRLLDANGQLVAIAEPSATPGLLHPSVVLK
jgi:tRNA pseudouridine55 synthase